MTTRTRTLLSRPTRTSAALAGCLALAPLACDEAGMQQFRKGDTGAAATAQDGKTGADKSAAAALERPLASYSECYGQCYAGHLSATNRETCKLDCDGLAEAELGALADPGRRAVYDHMRGCMMACYEDRSLSDTNRATCLLTCSDDAAVAAAPAPKRQLEVVPGTVLAPGTPLPEGVRPPAQ